MAQNSSPLDAIPATYLGTLSAETNTVERPVIKSGPFGTRVVATVSGASFVGPKINATMPEGTAAGDWLTIRDDGSMALDVRLCVRTDDGADIYVSYYGVGTTTDGVAQIRTAPRFETGDERYAWLNNVLGVGLGKRTETGVQYDVYTID
ncbi:MAG: DUF3237 domain-containing protein [Actinomycetia bacterium]|nr:DUF3237 domain-containing protein [Actinomycetes bacterium]